MAVLDRRSGEDRRAVKRRQVTIDVDWEGSEGRKPGTLSDLSPAGCFVLSSGEVTEGDNIRVFLPIDEGMKVQVLGEVRNHVIEIGFALKFVDTTEAQVQVISDLMAKFGVDR